MKLEVIIEQGDGELWGRIENKGFMPATVGSSVKEVLDNLKMLIDDHILHEGKEDVFWKKVNTENIHFDILYDLQAFFEEFSELKISSIAERAGLNPSLVRQYATGNKYPSAQQAKKIEDALHGLGKKLQQVAIYAS